MIIGRSFEIKVLEKILKSNEAEFIAVVGRRRVGKTYLIREFFQESPRFLEVVGIKDAPLKQQLSNFTEAVNRKFPEENVTQKIKTWKQAFQALTEKLLAYKGDAKQIVFLDELPWMSTPKSLFLQNLDHFWNAHWSKIKNLVLIVCGSSASFMLKHIIHAKGGLYHRLTQTLSLEPFTLSETEEYLKSRKVKLGRPQILELYLALGGIPHYLKQVEPGKSATQIINELCFRPSGLLFDEFSHLYQSLFDNTEDYCKIVRVIATKNKGLTRDEILKISGQSTGGGFNKRLSELIASGFIKAYTPYGYKKKLTFYRIIDEYTMFYLDWIEPFRSKSEVAYDLDYWLTKSTTASWISSAGYLFENVCYKHVPEIRKALKLEKISCDIGTWRYKAIDENRPGTQIDLLFDRADDIITLCEIKYSNSPFLIDKTYGQELLKKINTLESHHKNKKTCFLALITTFGLKKNLWSQELVSQEVTLSDLFVSREKA